MVSEKQLRANRENAKRSSGPKTAAGRLRSSRNALRHGLSLPLTADPAALMKARQLALMLVAAGADDMRMIAAVEMAQAHAQLLRVAAVRSKLVANLDFTSANLKQVLRLAALDRYERQALKRRRRAAQKLSAASNGRTD
ncbi:hypothetical protein [Bradyrhizobium cenepequi]|uniref:hypothetical protein n=1 Tax=Bradyrhizobium cenepequi TaxID=2821403 RepID=UPI001CE2416D|nr:hypothetical protein [Bradyrhizobium cenepequi]MCA6106972.1 hypothetical protein [Bradyrhizobium cenepequi]